MNEAVDVPRRGRPPKEEVKKGRPTWKPANIDEVIDRDPNFRYRWCLKDPDNLAKKKAEQWIVDENTVVEGGYGRIDDGKSLTSVRERKDSILMKIPVDVAEARDDYVNGRTQRQMASLQKQTKEELGKSDAPIHGSISMEQRGIRTVIKE